MRPPAVPLVAHDPYFSIWSMADRLNGDGTKHWTGKTEYPHRLRAHRWQELSHHGPRPAGRATNSRRRSSKCCRRAPSMNSPAPASTVGLTFFTPALPDDLDVLSRPLTYLEWSAASTDGREHEVAIYFDAAQRPGGQHAGPAGARRALSARRPSAAAHGLARTSRARQARRRSAHRLGLPLPRRRQGRRRHHFRRRSRAGARRLRRFGPPARVRRAWRGAPRRSGAGLCDRARQGECHARSPAT